MGINVGQEVENELGKNKRQELELSDVEDYLNASYSLVQDSIRSVMSPSLKLRICDYCDDHYFMGNKNVSIKLYLPTITFALTVQRVLVTYYTSAAPIHRSARLRLDQQSLYNII